MDDETQVTGQEPAEPQGRTFTEDEVNRLLTRERDKLHGKITKSDSLLDELRGTVADLQKQSEERAKAEAAARKEAEKLARQKQEAEMSAKDLIDARTAELQAEREALSQEWASRFSTLEQTMETERAVFAKERQMAELAAYTQQAVAAADIAPELTRFINGNSKEEIDASIAAASEASAAIFASIQQAQVAGRAAMPGVAPTGFTPSGPLDTQDATRQLSAQDINAMSMAEYQKYRAQLGTASAGQGKGLFG